MLCLFCKQKDQEYEARSHHLFHSLLQQKDAAAYGAILERHSAGGNSFPSLRDGGGVGPSTQKDLPILTMHGDDESNEAAAHGQIEAEASTSREATTCLLQEEHPPQSLETSKEISGSCAKRTSAKRAVKDTQNPKVSASKGTKATSYRPSQVCEHGKRKAFCKDCNGCAFCEHGKNKYKCKECAGSQRW